MWLTPPSLAHSGSVTVCTCIINHVACNNNVIMSPKRSINKNRRLWDLRMGQHVVVPGILDYMQGSWGYPGESFEWHRGRLAWCVLTAPRAVNTRAQNEYTSRIKHDIHVKSLFLFSMISVNTHQASRITLHASRVCGVVASGYQ